MTQANLFKAPIQERFAEFHEKNPHVYKLLVRYSREAKSSGVKKIGIAAIYERARWFARIETTDTRPFKLNNDYTSRYARLIMAQEPDLLDFFTTKHLRSA